VKSETSVFGSGFCTGIRLTDLSDVPAGWGMISSWLLLNFYSAK
jgi:hypothetical protein